MRWLLILSAGLAMLYLTALLGLFAFQRHLIYPRPATTAAPPTGFRSIRLVTGDALSLNAAYRPATGSRPTIVFFHGNGDSLDGAAVVTRGLDAAGFGLLLVEYRGYAGNPGTPDERGLYADGRAALDWLAARGIAGGRLVLIGNSLGSGVASQLATERPIGALVLVSPFTSMADAVGAHLRFVPVRLMLRDRFENAAKLRGRAIRLLVLHGVADALIPVAQGRALAAAVPGATFVPVAGAGHELAYLPGTQRAMIRWLGASRRSAIRPPTATIPE